MKLVKSSKKYHLVPKCSGCLWGYQYGCSAACEEEKYGGINCRDFIKDEGDFK